MTQRKDSVVVELVGGLGNQLFGLAFGLAISEKLNCNLELDESLINFGSNDDRKLEIHNYDFGFENFIIRWSFFTKIIKMSRIRIIKKLSGRIIINARNSINEANIKEIKIQTNKRYSGYFQEWMYADYLILKNHIFSPVPKNDRFKENIIFKEFNYSNPILVHIRLGDYLEFSKIYQILPEKYFLSAIDKLIQQNGSRPIWLVVEDVEQTQKFYPALSKLASKFIDKNLELEDYEVFYLMAKSNFLVASNSTFSLWASWFSLNAGGDVIVPSVFNVSGIPSKLIDQRWNSIDISNFSFIPKRDLGNIRNENLVRFNELFL